MWRRLFRAPGTRSIGRSLFPDRGSCCEGAWGRRLFSADASAAAEATQRSRRPPARKGGGLSFGPGVIATGGVLATGVGYAVSDDVQAKVDNLGKTASESFEDFNDWSREILEDWGDYFVPRKSEPWLLDLATMKYPEFIPTLVLDLDKVILHLEHDHHHGWHVVKRPHADHFFREIQHYYELVIFSDDVFPVAIDIMQKWAIPVTGVLHRDFCKKKREHYVKDLTKLGRKMEKMLIIDHDPVAFSGSPANGIEIRPFTGDPNDTELLDLLDFLKAAAQNSMDDLPAYVQKFGGGDKDLGRRYLVHKQAQDERIASRRRLSSGIATRSQVGSGFPGQPVQVGMSRRL